MFFYLEISSKNKETFKKFLNFLLKLKITNLKIKTISKQKLKQFTTVLKSPHVNKTAQEQFEFRIYKKKLIIKILKPFKLFYILKKLQNFSFPGINFKVNGCFIENKFKDLITDLDPDFLNLFFFINIFFYKNEEKTKKYLQMLDIYGNICLK